MNPSIELFPNPTSNRLIIRLDGLTGQDILVKLFALNGIQMFIKPLASNQTNVINLNGIPSGLYLLYVQSGNISIKKKLILN